MKVSMIAAMTPDRVIGTGHGGIPWHLPRDSQHFRSYTAGHHMLLGRRTFEEMDGWFTTQTPIVLTRDVGYTPKIGHAVQSVEQAIQLAEESGDTELVVSGGASIYALALPFAETLILTIVQATEESQARFPDYEIQGSWKLLESKSSPADDDNAYNIEIQQLQRSEVMLHSKRP